MTIAHHTPHANGAPLTSAEMNAPLSSLDSAIDAGDVAELAARNVAITTAVTSEAASRASGDVSLQAAIDALVVSGSGTSTTVNGAGAASGQKVVPVAATTGFVIGDSVFLVNPAGASETGIVASISAGVSLTMVANLTNTYAVASTVSKSPAEIVLARASIDLTYASLYSKLLYVREALTATRTYYVRTDGSDANNGKANTAGGAFLTIQKAVDTVKNRLDLNGFDVTITVVTGTYSAGATITGPWHGKGNVTILESGTVNIASTTGSCWTANGAVIYITGFKSSTSASGYDAYIAYNGSVMNLSPREVGAVVHTHFECQGSDSYINILTGYTISGGGVSHYHGSTIAIGAVTVTLTGTPAFSAYFAGLSSSGYQQIIGTTFTGAATGKRYVAHKTASIDCGGASETYLPGDVAGTTDAGGIYVGNQYDTGPFPQFKGWVQTATMSAATHNLGTGIATYESAFMIRLDASTAVDLTGLIAPTYGGQKIVYLVNASANNVTLKHASGSSLATNQFRCPGGADLILNAHDGVLAVYDSGSGTNVWRVVGT